MRTTNSNNKLSYDEFKELCRSEIAARLGSGHQVTLVQIYKNNSVCLDGIVIRQSGAPLGPNLYLNDEYEAYLDGKETETIIKELILSYHTFLFSGHIRPSLFPSSGAPYGNKIFPVSASFASSGQIS